MRLIARMHLVQVALQVEVELAKGRRLLRQRHHGVPHLETGRIETVECADIVDPGPHPALELRPTTGPLEEIPPHMRPAIGQQEPFMALGEAFVGAVPVTHQYHFYEVFLELGKMGLRHLSPTARGHAVVYHRRRARHPQIPAMPRLALHFCKHFPACFVTMEQLFAHLPRMEGLHHRLKQPRYSLQSIRESALGYGQTLILQFRTEAVGGTTIEVFISQYHRPDRHPQRAFRDQPRRRRRGDNPCDLRAVTRLLVTLALDAPLMGLDLDFDNRRLFSTRKWQESFPTGRAVFRRIAHVMHFGHHRQGGPVAAAVPLTARLLPPLAGTGWLGHTNTVGTR